MSDSSQKKKLSDSLLESLRQNNPFTSNAASDPWFNRFPDIASINRKAFDEVCGLIKRKTDEPRTPLTGLILGEAGMGKTHLLRRILLDCRKQNSSALFVFVKPLFDPNRPLHHLLQEIVLSLSKNNEKEQNFSQFDWLVAEIIRDYVRYRINNSPQDATPNNKRFLEHFEADVFHIYTHSKNVRDGSMEIIEKEAVRYIHSQVPETSKRFLDVIFQYKTLEKRGLVRDWLKGDSLDEEDCDVLGVPPRAELSDEAREQESREILLTLGALFTRYHLPMVLCFDQLDNLIQSELIAGFACMIHLLVNDAASMLPLAFIRADSWNERFMKHNDKAFTDRLGSNKIPLSNCNRKEARELVSRRIEQVFGDGTKETIAINNWLLAKLESKMSSDYSPREVILFANQIVRDASEDSQPAVTPTVAENLATEYKLSCEAIATDFDTWDPESEYLKKAAELFLKNQENVHSCEPGGDKYTTWTGSVRQKDQGNDLPYACFVNTGKHWQTVAATLDRCLIFLQNNPNGICTFVTDARFGFSPTWKVTNEKREKLESLGAHILVLDQPAAVRWYGLVSLSWKIGSGDVLLETERGLMTATEKDLANFLKKEFSAAASEGQFGSIVTTPTTKPKPSSSINMEKTKNKEGKGNAEEPSVTVETISEAEEYLRNLVEALEKFKLAVLPDGYINGPRFIRLRIVPVQEKGVTLAKIQRLANDLRISLTLQITPLIQAQSGYVSVDVPRKSVKPLLLSPLIRDGASTRPDSEIAVPLGAEIDGKTYWLNLADPTMSSILIGGTTGSGKSVLLQSIVLGIRLANPNVRTEFTLIDPKRVTFTNFPLEKIDAELLYDQQPALERLMMLVEKMEQRYRLFESEKCCDIAAYNIAHPKSPLMRHVTVIDEFADLMVEKATNKELELVVQRLGQKGRAAGFHLILATQRPEAKVISPLIKANLQVKIAMKVTSQANSNIILDQPGAECLIGNGDMLLGGSVALKRLQGPRASQTDYKSL